jgi:histidyl-tRNA synthetase
MLITNAPRGTNDFLPEDAAVYTCMEAVKRRVARAYGYDEIRTPIFEHTELFQRGIGDTTDIVEKEMYTFMDRGDRSLTLRPEGTASVVRAYLEHKLYTQMQPVKLAYMGPMFRYERPQAGRYRQFHQFGLEALGSPDASLDAEIIGACDTLYRELGLSGYIVQLNSIGCKKCRPAYIEALRGFARERIDGLCASCRSRYERNALRLLDCKVEGCRELTDQAPKTTEHLCDECGSHFETVKNLLSALGIGYSLNPRLVRGLDYYSRTVFEFVMPGIGSQDAIGGGGRYDSLVEECGGDPTPGVGVAIGLERIAVSLKQLGLTNSQAAATKVFIATLGDRARETGFRLGNSLRRKDIRTAFDYSGKGLKGQLKTADKLGAKLCVVLGDAELDRNAAVLRYMTTGEQREVPLNDIEDIVISEL